MSLTWSRALQRFFSFQDSHDCLFNQKLFFKTLNELQVIWKANLIKIDVTITLISNHCWRTTPRKQTIKKRLQIFHKGQWKSNQTLTKLESYNDLQPITIICILYNFFSKKRSHSLKFNEKKSISNIFVAKHKIIVVCSTKKTVQQQKLIEQYTKKPIKSKNIIRDCCNQLTHLHSYDHYISIRYIAYYYFFPEANVVL